MRLLFALVLSVASAAAVAETSVYRSTGDDGVPLFSDERSGVDDRLVIVSPAGVHDPAERRQAVADELKMAGILEASRLEREAVRRRVNRDSERRAALALARDREERLLAEIERSRAFDYRTWAWRAPHRRPPMSRRPSEDTQWREPARELRKIFIRELNPH